MKPIKHWIDGTTTAGNSTRTSGVWNPATGVQQAQLSFAEPSDVDLAVQAASAAFESWGDSSLSARTKVLLSDPEAGTPSGASLDMPTAR